MSANRTCNLCGAHRHALLYEVDGFPIVQCRTCGLVFVGTPPHPEELLSLYNESYYEDPAEIGYGGYARAEARKRHHSRGLLKELEDLTRPGAILEVGCAYGYFLDEARRRGWRVRGVEPSVHAARYAREQLGLEVSGEALADLPVEPDSLAAVALWDVIEHLPNPRQTIELAYAWLQPSGIIAVSTGDIRSLSARLHGAHWSLMTPPWHQFYFSRATLRQLLEQAGFELLKLGGDGNVGVDGTSAAPRVHAVLAAALSHRFVTAAARRFGAGSIMFAFARKVSQ